MRATAYLLLTVAVASLVLMLAAFFLALFGDLISPEIGARHWAKLALPFGMATLFFFGIGGALAREAAVREELDRALLLLRKDLDKALASAENARELVSSTLASVERFRRAAAQLPGAAPKDLVDLADLVVFEDNNPAQAAGYLQDLHQALGKLPKRAQPQQRPARAPQKS